MTKFLNESGLGRLVALIKQALSGKKDKDFVVNLTTEDGGFVSDKTFTEIYAACNEGRDVHVVLDDFIIYRPISISLANIDFSATSADGGDLMFGYLTLNNNNLWIDQTAYAQQELVSGTNIKTVNSTSLLGSGNIAVQPSKFIITATQQGASTNFNKTYAEILAAYNTGADIELHEAYSNDIYKFVTYNGDDEIITFECLVGMTTLCQWTVDSSDTWENDDIEYQRKLVNQVTIKSVNYTSLLGNGNVEVQPTLVSGTNIKTVNNNTLLGSGNVNLNDAAISYDGNAVNVLEDATNVQEALDLLDDAVSDKQDTLVSGTNIKTINNISLLGSGTITLDCDSIPYTGEDRHYIYSGDTMADCLVELDDAINDLGEPNEIASITTSESSASGGNNTVTITETDGTVTSFNVKNGIDGQNGVSLGEVAIADDQTTDDATKVLSARQGKLLGDDVTRLKDYEFGVKTYDEDDLVKNKSYSNNSSVVNARMTVLANYGCIKIPVTKGDKLTIATSGASGARAYSLCDEELAIYLVASSGKDTTSNPDTISVTKDGYCHINCKSIAYANFSVTHYYSLERQMLADNTRSLTQGEMNGTSDWIKDKLEELGWEYNQYVKSNGTTASQSNYCASPFIPVSGIKGHNITFCYMFNAWGTGCVAFYNSSNAFISGLYYTCNVNNVRTIDIGTGSSWDNVAYLRMTCNPDKLSECYILDNTTGEYIWKGSDYLGTIYENNLISYASFRDVLLVNEMGQSTQRAVSQKAVFDLVTQNTYVQFGKGFTLNSNANYRFFKLTPKAVMLLNASDKMTFLFSTKGTGGTNDYRYFRFGNADPSSNTQPSTNGAYIGWSYSRNLSANGVSYTLNKSGSNYPTPDVWIVTWDRINGIVKFYDHTTLVNTLSGDSYKKDRFVNDNGLLTILGGDNNTKIYDIRLFDYDISYVMNNADIKSEIINLDGAGILTSQFLGNYKRANNDASFFSQTNGFSGGGYAATCTYSLDGDDYHIVVKDGVTSTQTCGGKPYYIGADNKAQLEILEFEVVSGVIKTSYDGHSTTIFYQITDENGDEIADYNNIGAGKYTLTRTSSAVGARFDFYKVSGNVEVVMNRNMQYRPISCVLHLKGDTMYNKKFYDDQTESFITLYSDRTCVTEYRAHTMVMTPQRVIGQNISSADGLPHYPGEMAVVGNNVYIGLANYTWKQINNS